MMAGARGQGRPCPKWALSLSCKLPHAPWAPARPGLHPPGPSLLLRSLFVTLQFMFLSLNSSISALGFLHSVISSQSQAVSRSLFLPLSLFAVSLCLPPSLCVVCFVCVFMSLSSLHVSSLLSLSISLGVSLFSTHTHTHPWPLSPSPMRSSPPSFGFHFTLLHCNPWLHICLGTMLPINTPSPKLILPCLLKDVQNWHLY